jgi:hypothetical protein
MSLARSRVPHGGPLAPDTAGVPVKSDEELSSAPAGAEVHRNHAAIFSPRHVLP